MAPYKVRRRRKIMSTKGLTRREFLRGAALTGVGLVAAACAPSSPTPPPTPVKTEIIIGGARGLSGPNAIYEQAAFGPIYKMWIDEVNARGGLNIAEYGRQLPIAEPIIYDDTSDLGTMTRLVEKLIVEDKVDLLLPPCSTAFLFAAAPLFNKYGYILLGAEGGATTITDMLPTLPYFFGVLNYSNRNQIPALANIFEEVGVKSAAIMFLQDLHGIEYSGVAITELGNKGIELPVIKSVPMDLQDASPILQEAQAAEVDALLLFCYPPQSFLAIGQAIALGINFKAVLTGPGANFNLFPGTFGPAAEGVMGEGAWNCKSSPAAAEFCQKFVARYGSDDTMDWWGGLLYYGGLQFFEQAIEKAGTLDQAAIRDVMATERFNTVLGPTWFDMFGAGGGLLAVECHPGEIGQWQNGVFEVIDTGDKRTAEPIYPKPAWPAPA
jgi:branched-chain amino acid transport system substrate-binding protein